ncbi:MAG: urate hydroxylase PuuD [Rhizobiales bacterium]|nr:urate hydroxylase PuuD [Hyphomicrobiales bacterium]
MIAGIAWIGTSFYFIALDFSLQKREGLPAGVGGEAWEVHGGGFYHVQKYLSAPPSLPDHLTWFKWEAYLTWVTGFLLLVVQYYLNAESFLIDPAVLPLTATEAIAISLLSIAGGWIVYDQLCRLLALRHPTLLILCVILLIAIAAYGFTHVYSGRGAFIHVGVFIGTTMAANVFMVIIPNQRKIVAALMKGERPDPRHGAMGKQRSLHNTYLTLPVLLMMVSNHYAFLTGHPQSWILILLIVVGGASLRHYLVRTEVGDEQREIAWLLPVIGAVLALAVVITTPAGKPAFTGEVSDADVLAIAQGRCVSCHAAKPADTTFSEAPKGVMLESLDDLRRHKPMIMVQAVNNAAMPLGNKTGMTPEERARLGAWLARQP